MTSYYPEGTRTDADPFNPGPQEQEQHVSCDAQEDVNVVPATAVKTVLRDLITTLELIQEKPVAVAVMCLSDVEEQARRILEEVESLEDLGAWTCSFEGDLTVVRTGGDDASWTCPTCGTEQSAQWDEYTREDFDSDRAERAYDEARGK